jgi:hypothetical protein
MKYFFSFVLLSLAFLSHAQSYLPPEKMGFLSNQYLQTFALKAGQTETGMHVYNSASTEKEDVSRLVDIRWSFKYDVEAEAFFNENYLQQSEEGAPIFTTINNANISQQKVYIQGANQYKINRMLGLRDFTYWIFIFRIKNIVAKVFIAGHNTPYQQALVIASTAANNICNALGLANATVPTYTPSIVPLINSGLGKNIINVPPMFINNKLDTALSQFFDVQYSLINDTDSCLLKYKVWPYDAEGYSADSATYIKNRYQQFVTVPLNYYMQLTDFSKVKERFKSNAGSKALANADYIYSTVGEISTNSKLASGYKYGMIYIYFTKNRPTIAMFIEYNNTNVLDGIDYQVFNSVYYNN